MTGDRFGAALRSAGWKLRTRRILALLEDERDLILRGDLRGLAASAPRSQAAMDELSRSAEPDPHEAEPDLAAIRLAASRNRRLLAALMEGAASARKDLASMEAARSRLGYDRSGAPVGAVGAGKSLRA